MKINRLRSVLGLSSLTALMLTTSALAVSRITMQPQHVIAPLGGEVISQIAVEPGYAYSMEFYSAVLKCCCKGQDPRCRHRVMSDVGAVWWPSIPSTQAGASWIEITGSDGKEKSSVFQITIVDQLLNTPIDRAVGGSVSITARCWNPPRSAALQWYDSSHNLLVDGVSETFGTISGAQTPTITFKRLPSVGRLEVYAKVKGYGPESLNTAPFVVNVSAAVPVIPKTALGNYVGILPAGPMNGNAGGRIDLTVGSKAITGKVRLAGQPEFSVISGAPSVSGNTLVAVLRSDIYPPKTVILGIDTTTNTTVSSFIVEGSNSTPFTAWRGWNPPRRRGARYNFVLPVSNPTPDIYDAPDGKSWGALTLGTAGAYTIAGRTALGEAFTCSAVCGPGGGPNAILYSVVGTSKSVISGNFQIDFNAAPSPSYVHHATMQWTRPRNGSLTYSNGFRVNLLIDGGLYTPNNAVLSSYVTASGAVDLTFRGVGLSNIQNEAGYLRDSRITPTDLDVAGANSSLSLRPPWWPRTIFRINTATGLSVPKSSKSNLSDYNVATRTWVERTLTHNAILYPTPNTPQGWAVDGYFLVPQLATSIIDVPATYSGSVSMRAATSF